MRFAPADIVGLSRIVNWRNNPSLEILNERHGLISSVSLVVTYSFDGAAGPANWLSRAFLSVLRRIGRLGGNHVRLGKAEATCRYNGFSRTARCEAYCVDFDGRLDDASVRAA